GCGQCVRACAEGAIQMIDGKARLVSEIYCDGLGACLDCCPTGAITIEQRQAEDFDEEAVKKHLAQLAANKTAFQKQTQAAGSVCPGMRVLSFAQEAAAVTGDVSSQLRQWPVQLALVSPTAPYFVNADLMLTADCVPFAMGDFHSSLLGGKAIAIACPKLDDTGRYIQKLADIFTAAKPKSLTVVHMEVPCCSGLRLLAQKAIALAGIALPIRDITVSLHGRILSDKTI
ncbi:MAG TPA: hypothetical protein PK525_13060, partial [Anaerohalosphaeraceae bacterium]|nr:hypothetical protein [Anaerohalosphaeraceae bacterium]